MDTPSALAVSEQAVSRFCLRKLLWPRPRQPVSFWPRSCNRNAAVRGLHFAGVADADVQLGQTRAWELVVGGRRPGNNCTCFPHKASSARACAPGSCGAALATMVKVEGGMMTIMPDISVAGLSDSSGTGNIIACWHWSQLGAPA